jgi:hypothetical protein
MGKNFEAIDVEGNRTRSLSSKTDAEFDILIEPKMSLERVIMRLLI